MAAGLHMVEIGKVGDLFERGEAASVGERQADIVDPLVADKVVDVPDGVEDFASGEGRGGVLANEAKAFLKFGWDWIFHPEKVEGLEFFAEARGFNGREAVMTVVEEVKVVAEPFPYAGKEPGNVKEVLLGGPAAF